MLPRVFIIYAATVLSAYWVRCGRKRWDIPSKTQPAQTERSDHFKALHGQSSSSSIAEGEPLSSLCNIVPVQRAQGLTDLADAQPQSIEGLIAGLKPFASGAFGKVYSAQWNKMPVAVKQTSYSQNNIDEINNLIRLQGLSGIPTFLYCELQFPKLYLLEEELYNAMSSDEIVDAMKGKSFVNRLKLYQGAMKTLAGIHEKDIIHGDIKPENMMADSQQIHQIYLIDFNVSKKRGHGVRAGTPDFWSPRMFRDEDGCLTQAEDIWALMMSIAELEFGRGYLPVDEYRRCVKNGYPLECRNFLMTRIKEALLDKYEDLKEYCKGGGIQKFWEILNSGLEYDEALRSSAGELADELSKAMKLCLVDAPGYESKYSPLKEHVVESAEGQILNNALINGADFKGPNVMRDLNTIMEAFSNDESSQRSNPIPIIVANEDPQAFVVHSSESLNSETGVKRRTAITIEALSDKPEAYNFEASNYLPIGEVSDPALEQARGRRAVSNDVPRPQAQKPLSQGLYRSNNPPLDTKALINVSKVDPQLLGPEPVFGANVVPEKQPERKQRKQWDIPKPKPKPMTLQPYIFEGDEQDDSLSIFRSRIDIPSEGVNQQKPKDRPRPAEGNKGPQQAASYELLNLIPSKLTNKRGLQPAQKRPLTLNPVRIDLDLGPAKGQPFAGNLKAKQNAPAAALIGKGDKKIPTALDKNPKPYISFAVVPGMYPGLFEAPKNKRKKLTMARINELAKPKEKISDEKAAAVSPLMKAAKDIWKIRRIVI